MTTMADPVEQAELLSMTTEIVRLMETPVHQLNEEEHELAYELRSMATAMRLLRRRMGADAILGVASLVLLSMEVD